MSKETMSLDDVLEAVLSGATAEMEKSGESADEFVEKASKDLGRKIKRPKTIPTEVAEKAMKAHADCIEKVLSKVNEQMVELIDLHVEFEKKTRKRLSTIANLMSLARGVTDSIPVIAKSDDEEDVEVDVKVGVKTKE